MSLKVVHICFILLSILLTLGFGFWGIRDYTDSGNAMNLFLGASSLIAGGGLIYYLFRFVQKMKRIHPLWVIGILLSSKPAWACSVCFGDPNSSLSQGANAAILFLMGVVLFVLTGVAATLWIWARRARRLARSHPAA